MKRRSFKSNKEYFKFINKMKNKIEIIEVLITNKIRVKYKLI